MTHEERIARYSAAFERANRRPTDFQLVYEKGWYRLRNSWGREIGCYRAAKLDGMIQLLEWRGSEDYRKHFGATP